MNLKARMSRRLRKLMSSIFVGTFLCATALLPGCGGGGGGTSAPPPVQQPPTPRAEPLRFGYFGIDGPQLQETADHVNYVLAPDWGPWDAPDYDAFRITQIVMQLQEAQSRGVREAWVMVGFLVFSQTPGCRGGPCYHVRPDGMVRLATFRTQLQALGLDGMVKVLYPVDEPELHGLDDGTLNPLLQSIKAVWPNTLLAAIYGDTHSYPGIAQYDLVGKDHYDRGPGVLDEMPPITAAQRYVLVPGGSSPWSNDPQPFYDFAMQHGMVYAICAFVWFDRTDEQGRPQKGIRSNGMAPAYTRIGQQIKEQG